MWEYVNVCKVTFDQLMVALNEQVLSKRKETVRLPCAVPTSTKVQLCSCAHFISDITSFSCRDQGRDSVRSVI